MAFPCFDEPTFRSTFALSLILPDAALSDGLVALSNMPEEARHAVTGTQLRKIDFAATPCTIPTYLTCWSVGRYDHVEGASKGGVPVRYFSQLINS